MNRKEKIQAIRETGKTMKSIKIQFVENGNDLLILGNFTQKEIELINSGKVKIIEDLTQVSTEMLRRIAYNGYKPAIYYKSNGNNAESTNN